MEISRRAAARFSAAMHKPRRLISRFRLRIWELEGEERETGLPLRVLYAGRRRGRAYFSKTAFASAPKATERGTAWLPAALRSSAREAPRCPLAVLETPRFFFRIYPRSDGYFVPSWVGLKLDISEARRRIKNHSGVKSDLRKARKAGFVPEITTDPALFDLFYHRMYVPYIRRSHGEAAAFSGDAWLKKHASRGELLLVKRSGEYVAGVFRLFRGSQAGAVLIGIRDGDPGILKAGVTSLMFADCVSHIGRRGYRRMRLGNSRSFIRDGSLQFKRKWGGFVFSATKNGLWIRIRDDTPGGRAFLTNNPFIARERGRMVRVSFLDNPVVWDRARLAALEKRLRIGGAPDLRLVLLDGSPGEIEPPELPGRKITVEMVRPLGRSPGRR